MRGAVWPTVTARLLTKKGRTDVGDHADIGAGHSLLNLDAVDLEETVGAIGTT